MMGQRYKNKLCGSFGDVSTFSFYANKTITSGEGGMVITKNKYFYETIEKYKNLYFGNAPDTFLGGGGQMARQLIDKREIGKILTTVVLPSLLLLLLVERLVVQLESSTNPC